MGILITPKSNAEVNQLVSVLHSTGFNHFHLADNATNFKVGVTAVLWEHTRDYCHQACLEVLEDLGNNVTLTVNELGQYLQRS